MEIQEIKSRLSIASVLAHYGLRPDKNHRLNCPFHDDRTPSMQVYHKTDTVYCFSSSCSLHGKSLDQIDLILHMEKCSKAEAINMAKAMIGEPVPQTQKAEVKPMTKADISRVAVLTKVLSEARASLERSAKAQGYCKSRGLDHERLELGFLEERYHRNWNDALKQNALNIGILKEQANKSIGPAIRHCIVFAMRNRAGEVVDLYGRSVMESKEAKHFYLKGKHQGLYPKYPATTTKKLILTESIIDAASLLQLEEISQEHEVLACYGTNGFTAEHEEAMKELKALDEIIIFFDGDEAGETGAERLEEKLKSFTSAKISKVPMPEGEDVNSLLQSHEAGILKHLLEQRKPVAVQEAQPHLFSTEEQPEQPEQPVQPAQPESVYSLDTRNPDRLTYEREGLKIEVWGGVEKSNLHRLKLSLCLTSEQNGQSFRDDVNLYSNRSLKQFLQDACEELELSQTELKGIMQEFTREIEAYRLEQKEQAESLTRPEKVVLSQLEQQEAVKHLKDKNLVKNLRLAMQKCGLIGETDNGLLLFLIFLTRYFDSPLHALVHGSSGSGKTNLLKTILKLVPEESKYETTALSENVLFRPPYKSFWRHKILLLEDLDGSYKALLPLREFMTAQKISKFVTEHDLKTGTFKQVLLQAEGPICIAGATTKDRIYEDNSNRSFLIHVNESRAHQEAVLEYQNRKAAGLIDSAGIEVITRKVQNIQRMLDGSIRVVNPFQPFLKLPEYVFKKLRTNTHYITLIQVVTFLHQYQREVKRDSEGMRYIETTLEDVELANALSKESLLRKSDELSGAVREFFEALKYTVRESGKECFTAKEIRERFRMHPMQLKRRLDELSNRGYIKLTGGNRRLSFEYEISTWDDYKLLQDALKLMDNILAELWQRYPDGKYVKGHKNHIESHQNHR